MMKGINEILRNAYEEEMKKFIQDLYLVFQKVSYKGGLFVTDFLNPYEQHYFQEVSYLFKNLFVRLEGGIPLCERKRGFITDNKDLLDYIDLEKYFLGIELISKEKISPFYIKKNLTQKGIDEKKLGDIWILESKIQFICEKEIEKNLENVLRDLNIEFYFLSLNNLIPKKSVKILKTVEASLRLDAIVSFAFNISRTRVQEIIKNGAVTVNNKNVTYPYYEIKEQDLVSVKNLGYFKIRTLKKTSKGKFQIEIEKY
ncbi:MAG: S4 domain-containing protein [Dictyoglomus sp.]|nr:S4 domain-containing protein [Dictyoglomus sp.]MDW8187805.1 S4 domain-containing protein [Dictyoglomus sp.]